MMLLVPPARKRNDQRDRAVGVFVAARERVREVRRATASRRHEQTEPQDRPKRSSYFRPSHSALAPEPSRPSPTCVSSRSISAAYSAGVRRQRLGALDREALAHVVGGERDVELLVEPVDDRRAACRPARPARSAARPRSPAGRTRRWSARRAAGSSAQARHREHAQVPAVACSWLAGIGANAIGIWPPSRSVIAGPVPL